MTAPHETLTADARRFLSALAANNTRDWFQANKARYEADLKKPAIALLDLLTDQWGREIGQPLKPKLFRANRDVRFSKDKTPYHTHLHMLWAEADGPGWFLGISPDYVTAGAGIMGMDKDRLTAWRAAVDSPLGAELAELVDGLDARLDPPELKRVPAPYDKDHPQQALLRRKSFALWRDIAARCETADLADATVSAFRAVRPAMDLLRRML